MRSVSRTRMRGCGSTWPLFRNDITNRIQAVGDTRNAAVRIYQNRAESELVGLELQSNFVLARAGDATSVNLGINAAHHFRMRDLDAAARELSTDRIIRVYETQGSLLLGVHNPGVDGAGGRDVLRAGLV